MTPWVTRLLIVNVAMFLLSMIFPLVPRLLLLVPAYIPYRPWSVVTYMFLHAGLWHLFFNMLALYFFGPRLEARLGSRQFISLYFASGIVAALASLMTPHAAIVGASGAVFGVLLGFARFWPRAQIYIWGVLPIEARWLVVIMTGLSLYGGSAVRGAAWPTSRTWAGSSAASCTSSGWMCARPRGDSRRRRAPLRPGDPARTT